jgi:hypothetical protein
MSSAIDSLKQRKIQLYEVQAGPELVKVSVEMASPRETRVGVSITLGSHSRALDSSEIHVKLLGKGHFNPVEFPREGSLPELRTGSARGAVAAFRFEAVESHLHPTGLELGLRGRAYHVRFGKAHRPPAVKKPDIPAGVAKLLPKRLLGAKRE